MCIYVVIVDLSIHSIFEPSLKYFERHLIIWEKIKVVCLTSNIFPKKLTTQLDEESFL